MCILIDDGEEVKIYTLFAWRYPFQTTNPAIEGLLDDDDKRVGPYPINGPDRKTLSFSWRCTQSRCTRH